MMMNDRRPSWRLVLSTLVLLGLILAVRPAGAQDLAGDVVRLRGTAEAILNGESRSLAAGDSVFVTETLVTGPETRLELRLRDGTEVSLGDETRLEVAEFLFDNERQEGRGILRLTSGVFRAITGALSKLHETPLTVETPVATIGIRGTDFWGAQEAGSLRMALLEGGPIVIENDAGRIELSEARQLTVIAAPGVPPSPPIVLSDEQLNAAASTVAF